MVASLKLATVWYGLVSVMVSQCIYSVHDKCDMGRNCRYTFPLAVFKRYWFVCLFERLQYIHTCLSGKQSEALYFIMFYIDSVFQSTRIREPFMLTFPATSTACMPDFRFPKSAFPSSSSSMTLQPVELLFFHRVIERLSGQVSQLCYIFFLQ